MTRQLIILSAAIAISAAADIHTVRSADPRNLANGERIPAESYVDQPYVAVTPDGTWVCLMTTGKGLEGQPGQHIVSTTSQDHGKTWSELIDIEPDSGPEASWATPLITPSGRIYAFYVYNGDDVTTLPNSERRIRSDTHGWYVFRYSDDAGRSWSARRFRVPIRTTDIDRQNSWNGETMHFWSIDKPVTLNGSVYLALTKLRRHFMHEGEGWVIESPNILTEQDPDKITFNLLPGGDRGIHSPALGSVQEEHNIVPLGTNGLFCAMRLEGRTPAHSYSHDGGATWTEPAPMTYGPGKRPFKNPRACPKLFLTAEGRYLFWFHNHGGRAWAGRNPAFLSGGTLKEDGFIHWSEPELILFDPRPNIRFSYPDLIQMNSEFWITETQKTIARVHHLDRALLDGLWNQEDLAEVSRLGMVLELTEPAGAPVPLPRTFGDFSNGGLTVELWTEPDTAAPGQTLLSTLTPEGQGLRVTTSELGGQPTLAIELSDGIRSTIWHSDPGTLQAGKLNHTVFICDFAATIISVIADGTFCDGGDARQYGWGRLPTDTLGLRGHTHATLSPAVQTLRLYDRPLRTTEAVGNYRTGLPAR